MQRVSRGACASLAALTFGTMYCGAWWVIWPCRQSAVGRELREGRSLKPLHRAGQSGREKPCPDASQIAVDVRSSGAILEVGSHSVSFVSPWTTDQLNAAYEKASKSSYFDKQAECTGINFREIVTTQGQFVAAYHKQNALATLKDIQTKPGEVNSELCPKSAELLVKIHSDAENGQTEIDDQIDQLKTFVRQNRAAVGEMTDARGTVHFADLENAIRAQLEKPLLPISSEFIATHWVPIVTKIYHHMSQKKYNLDDDYKNFVVSAVHVYLVSDQLEELRQKLLTSPAI